MISLKWPSNNGSSTGYDVPSPDACIKYLAYIPRENKVEILTLFYYTERSNLEDSSSYGGGGGYRGGSGGYGGGGRRFGGNRFGGPRPFKPSPVRVGEEYEVKIESMSKRGDSGVARVQGLVIFVASTKVGDSVKIRITKVGRGYATAEVAGQAAAGEAVAEAPTADAEESGDMESETEEEEETNE
jgi:predicted RNA-binding protein with TRAM domain